MKRINIWWYLVLIFWLLIGFSFIIINKKYNIITIEDTNLMLGIISVAISLVSVAIATMKLPKFKGKVYCWNIEKNKRNVNNKASGADIGVYNSISFEIDNFQKTAIQNLVVNFRIPKSIINAYRNNNSELKFRESKDTVIVTFDNLRFLGNSNGDCKLNIDHFLNISKWKEEEYKRVIYVTVAGDNIEPTTLRLKSESIDNILLSTQEHKKKVLLSK
jgi:hypothetical protein